MLRPKGLYVPIPSQRVTDGSGRVSSEESKVAALLRVGQGTQILLIHLISLSTMPHPFHSTQSASMTSPTRSVHAREGAFILNESPDLFIGEHVPKADHGRAGRAMFNDPENLAFRTMPPESMVLKIAR